MRILIPTAAYYPAMNGQAVFATNLAEGLARHGHSVMVVVDSQDGNAFRKEIKGVTVIALKAIRLNIFHTGVFFTPNPASQVRKLVNEFKPDIVHIQDHYPICQAAVRVARKQAIKIVGSNHFVPENYAPYVPLLFLIKPVIYWLFWQWMLMVYRPAEVITAQSRAAADIVKRAGWRKPVLPISCGIDLDHYYPDQGEDRNYYRGRYGMDLDKKIFLFLGRVDGEKRIDLLVRVMKQLQRDDIQVAIAGKGRVEKEIRRMVESNGLEKRVRLTGFIPEEDVRGLLNSIDVFVMPSEAELLSISTLEAMACGCPVLLAEALALPELVQNGVNGYTFNPGDVDDLARLMNRMADEPERWVQMGVESRRIAYQHSLQDTIEKFENLYLGLIHEETVDEAERLVKEATPEN